MASMTTTRTATRDVELAGDLDWEPGAGLVYLRRLNDSQVWRAGFTVTARPHPERPARWR